MLHPHAPEGLKGLGKHILATFLGLLMALGLENWREHRHEASLLREALNRVNAELLENQKDLQERLPVLEDEQKPLEAYAEAMNLAAHAAPGKAVFPQRPQLKNLDFNFNFSAWESAKAAGLLRQLDPERLQRLSQAYTTMQRVVQVYDQMVQGTTMQDLWIFDGQDPATLTIPERERLGHGLMLRCRRQKQLTRLGKEILRELQEAQRP